MPKHRSDYAKIEWSFIINDPRFYKMEHVERLAFLCLWVYAVATRRDWWMPEAFREACDNVALHSRLPPFAIADMVGKALDTELITRRKGGAYVLEGVRLKHPNLRGWCRAWGKSNDGPQYSTVQDRTPHHSIGKEKRRGF